MSQYAVLWNEKSKTLTIKDDSDKPVKDAFTHIYEAVEGEIPDPASHPQPAQHLKSKVEAINVDFRQVTIKNDSGNPRLDRLEKTGEEPSDNAADQVRVVNDEQDETVPRVDA